MESPLSNKEIGQRLTALRKAKGLSQEELANSIGNTRSSLSRKESGITGLDVLDLLKLSRVLNFSLDEFLADEYYLLKETVLDYSKVEKEKKRISVPEFNQLKFRNVLLYILENCAGRPNIGEAAISRLMYFCDFNYYEQYEEHLTGSNYRKLPFGPVPEELDSILQMMIKSKELQRVKTQYMRSTQIRYLPLIKPDLTQLSAAEVIVIDDVLNQMRNWNISSITEYAHKDMPWIATDESDYISYNLVFYRELPYSTRVYYDET